jgi:plastocyanin
MNRGSLARPFATVLPLALFAVLAAYPPRADSQEAKPSSTEVRVDNFAFAPQTLTVPANSTVTWVNKDDVPHVIASDQGVFKSKALDTDDKYSYTFTKPGTYTYFCSIHPKMTGTIVVH